MKYVVYTRVSTVRQGQSGLGLEAQEMAVARFIDSRPGDRLQTFTETESGKSHVNRPELAKAIAMCKSEGAVLLIAKLDRLARDVHFVSGLMKEVDFLAADMPNADKFMIHIYAAMAEREREFISERTKAAFQVLNRRLGHMPGRGGREKSASRAFERAASIQPIIAELAEVGITSHRDIARELNERGVETPKGGRWHPTSVARTLERLAA